MFVLLDLLLCQDARQVAALKLAARVDGVNAARVENINDDAGAGGAVDGLAEVPLQRVGRYMPGDTRIMTRSPGMERAAAPRC